jgi:ATP-dependent exoDNAse (exonuclease V) beta subunit
LTIHRSKGLEFDNVLLPVTWFDPRPWQKDKFSLRRRSDGIRMDWEWNFDRGAGEVTITNVRADLGNPFVGRGQEVIQSQKEDARLLYVAMTRARLRLTCLIPESMGTMQWCRYLHEGLGS